MLKLSFLIAALIAVILCFAPTVQSYVVTGVEPEEQQQQIADKSVVAEDAVSDQDAILTSTAGNKGITGFPCPYTTYTEVNLLNADKTQVYCVAGPVYNDASRDYVSGYSVASANFSSPDCIWRMSYCPVGYDQSLAVFLQSIPNVALKYITCISGASPECFRYGISFSLDIGQYFTRSSLSSTTSLKSTYNSAKYLNSASPMNLASSAVNFHACAVGSWYLSTC